VVDTQLPHNLKTSEGSTGEPTFRFCFGRRFCFNNGGVKDTVDCCIGGVTSEISLVATSEMSLVAPFPVKLDLFVPIVVSSC